LHNRRTAINLPTFSKHDHLAGPFRTNEGSIMTIGFSIFLLAVGAILTLAVDATVAGLDIAVVGIILMAAGVLGLILSVFVFAPRRRRTVTENHGASSVGPSDESSTVTSERASGPPAV
jgi:hypothetical protein